MGYYQEKKRYNKYSNTFYDPIPPDFQGSSFKNDTCEAKQESLTKPGSSDKNGGSFTSRETNLYGGLPKETDHTFGSSTSEYEEYKAKSSKNSEITLLDRMFLAFMKRKDKNGSKLIIIIPFLLCMLLGFAGSKMGFSILAQGKILKLTFLLLLIEVFLFFLFVYLPASPTLEKALQNILKLFCISFLVLPLLFGNMGLITLLNILLDSHSETTKYVLVTSKSYYETKGRKGRRSDHYKVCFTWNNGVEESIDNSSIFSKASENTVTDFTTKPGFLGVEHWISSKSFSTNISLDEFPKNTVFPVSKEYGDELRKAQAEKKVKREKK